MAVARAAAIPNGSDIERLGGTSNGLRRTVERAAEAAWDRRSNCGRNCDEVLGEQTQITNRVAFRGEFRYRGIHFGARELVQVEALNNGPVGAVRRDRK